MYLSQTFMKKIYLQIARNIKKEHPKSLIKDIVESLEWSDIEDEIQSVIKEFEMND